MLILFWILLFIVFYTYIGYGVLLYIAVKIKDCGSSKQATTHDAGNEFLPDVTLFITAYNEEDYVKPKMQNSLAIDYPADKLHILWVTDGSDDRTNQLLSEYPQATLLFRPQREGKTAAMNRGMQYVDTPIVIYTDANTMINRQAVREIVSQFADPSVGCVSGEKRISAKDEDSASSSGEGFYWQYESTLKSLDYRLYSVVGAAGELFAIRSHLFRPMPADTLLDDFVLSLSIAAEGHRIAYCRKAFAIETGTADMREERKRKVRIAAGGLQSLWRLRTLFNIFRYGTLSFQYISHRALRWTVAPIALFALLPVNIWLVAHSAGKLYSILLLLQVLFYILAIAGSVLSSKNIRVKGLFIPYYFLFMNASVFRGFFYLNTRKHNQGWAKAKRK